LGIHVLGANHPEDVRNQLKAAKAQHRLLKRLPKLEADNRISGFDILGNSRSYRPSPRQTGSPGCLEGPRPRLTFEGPKPRSAWRLREELILGRLYKTS